MDGASSKPRGFLRSAQSSPGHPINQGTIHTSHPGNAQVPSLQIDGHLLDLPGEAERQLVGKVYGRPQVSADVQTLAERELVRHRPRQLTLTDLLAVGAATFDSETCFRRILCRRHFE